MRSIDALKQATALALRGDDEAAGARLADALARDPRPPSAPFRMLAARLFVATGRVAEALEQLDALREVRGMRREERVSALVISAEIFERLGFTHEAHAAIEEAIALGPTVSLHVRLAFLLRKRDSPERALAALRTALAIEPRAANIALEAAGLAAELGKGAEAKALARAALSERSDDPVYKLEAAHVCFIAGAFEEAEALFTETLRRDPDRWEAALGLGRLALYRGDTASALARAAAVMPHEPAAAESLRACAELVAERLDEARAAAARALARDERMSEAYLIRAEVALREGRIDEALADVDRGILCARGYCFAGRLIHQLGEIARTGAWLGSDHAIEELRGPLLSMFPDAAPIAEGNDTAAMRALLERALDALSGNRTVHATMRVAGAGTASVRRLEGQSAPRFDSRRVLQSIAVEPPDEVLRRFAEVIDRYPRSPTPLCHRGELYMWLGRYEEALCDFEAALAITVARWGYIGKGAAELLLGEPARALDTFALGVEKLCGTTGPSLFIYRGEALLRAGDLDAAIADLRHSTESTPRRISAWVLSAIALDRKGDHEGCARALRELAARAPGLVYDACRETGARALSSSDGFSNGGRETTLAALDHMLVMMRGNRSSTCVTYFTREGKLRGVPSRAADHEARRRRELEDLARTAARLRA